MNVSDPRELFSLYHRAAAFIAVRSEKGDISIGSAFHVGEGVFVTARHVVEGRKILEVGIGGLYSEIYSGTIEGPFFHPDSNVDVAALVLEQARELPFVHLGGHMDDWINDDAFVLSEAIILGYPPVPMTAKPFLVTSRAEINAVIDLRDKRHVHFIVSTLARGGFSGAVALWPNGVVLGLVTQSLLRDQLPEELGYLTVLSVEPIYVLLEHHGILPFAQDEMWHAEWFVYTGHRLSGDEVLATLMTYHRNQCAFLELECSDKATLDMVIAGTIEALGTTQYVQCDSGDSIRLTLEDASRQPLESAIAVAKSLLNAAGFSG